MQPRKEGEAGNPPLFQRHFSPRYENNRPSGTQKIVRSPLRITWCHPLKPGIGLLSPKSLPRMKRRRSRFIILRIHQDLTIEQYLLKGENLHPNESNVKKRK